MKCFETGLTPELQAPLAGFWNTSVCLGVLGRLRGSIAERSASVAKTNLCVAETRQPGSATVASVLRWVSGHQNTCAAYGASRA